jgi:polysaccharide biosynthesis protein VpsQ
VGVQVLFLARLGGLVCRDHAGRRCDWGALCVPDAVDLQKGKQDQAQPSLGGDFGTRAGRGFPSASGLTFGIMKAKAAALLFFLFLLFVIWAADTGQMPPLFRAMYDFPNGDRVGHVVLYGILSFLLSLAFPRAVHRRRFTPPIVIIALLLFSVVEECSQSLFSSRTADAMDLVCSCTGILLGYWAAAFRVTA